MKIMKKSKFVLLGLVLVTVLSGCSKNTDKQKNENSNSDKKIETVITNISNPNYQKYANLSDIKSTKGIGGDAEKYYTKYIGYTAPNKKEIKILAQDKISDEQLLYAHSILDLYLKNLTKSYGENIANTLADSGNYLVMPNGADTGKEDNAIIGQPQYQFETANVGSKWYIENDYEHRDSAYEEIFHFVHMSGIGTEKNKLGSNELADKINSAKINALPKDKKDWGKKGIWGINAKESLEEWDIEVGSQEAEYIICVIDTYYGNWQAADTTALFGEYLGKQRSDLKTVDPQGLKVVESFLPKQMNIMMRVDPSFDGTFKMYLDNENKYTYKSQYLDMLTLTGDKKSNIIANENDNILIGNKSDNNINGKGGNDIVQLSGESTEYKITKKDGKTVIEDTKNRDGVDTLENIEILRFTDKDISI